MRIHIIAVGKKMPTWVVSGYQEFEKRLPRDFNLSLTEIPLAKRTGSRKSAAQLQNEEGAFILQALIPNATTIALDVNGKQWTTEQFTKKIMQISLAGQAINFLIGGPDGLSEACLKKATLRLSLSSMVLPHPLVRVILIEQLYRAHCLVNHLPYAQH